ncbi:MAG: hypothetical protein HN392_00025 [Anaerolineae bacterium]|mgnify:CR=1 FL=1|jgi:hypothetical protein|nr:hypothetical protein [Anaerolineae bacterium]MBT7075649.1 hypothetical protein [Anaerolineae bacterium]MBT7781473.1 hypothetical protein [Anaerolineae bacterium]
MSGKINKKFFLLFIGLFFILACNIGTPTTSEAPAFDATKAILELEATSLALQLTQAAINNQSAPPAVATAIPQAQATAAVAPTVATVPTEAPAMSEDFETWKNSASILLFEDMAGAMDRRRYVNQALNGMGLNYVDVADALGDYKNQILSGGPGGRGWDLIISAKEFREGVQGEFYVYLSDALNQGSAVIIEEWDMDDIGLGKLSRITGRCGVSLYKDWNEINTEAHVIFPIDGTHPVHHTPNSGISLTNPTGYWIFGDLGDQMKLSPGSEAEPLWGLYPNTKNKALTAVSCIEGRLIIQTYSTHSYGEDRVIRMWENYIYNTLKARYDYLASQ